MGDVAFGGPKNRDTAYRRMNDEMLQSDRYQPVPQSSQPMHVWKPKPHVMNDENTYDPQAVMEIKNLTPDDERT